MVMGDGVDSGMTSQGEASSHTPKYFKKSVDVFIKCVIFQKGGDIDITISPLCQIVHCKLCIFLENEVLCHNVH